MDTPSALETPSGKKAGDENFPVGSLLLSPALRPHIARFYAFARAIDDIADNPDLEPADKIARLNGFAEAVCGRTADNPGYSKAYSLHESLKATGVTPQHCLDLTLAFKQDAVKLRYEDWDDLMGYCILSAAPVGRYLVDLHGESMAAYAAADALCNALQVLNHLQDCGDDYMALDRVYLPQAWMRDENVVVDALSEPLLTPPLRRVLDRCLDATDTLIREATMLPSWIRGTRFAMEAAAIVAIAQKLSAELRRRDPLAERVVLSRAQYATCCARGALGAVFRRTPVKQVARFPAQDPSGDV